MATKLIVDTASVLQRMSLPTDVSSVSDAIDSALASAHVFFEGRLGTQITALQALTDYFFVDSKLIGFAPNGLYRLRLRQAFVKTGTVSLTTSYTRKGIHAVGADPVLAEDFEVDLVKGLVYLDESLADRYVAVTYSAGFDSANKPPEWLVEAMYAYIPSVLNLSQPTNRDDESLKVAIQVQNLAGSMVDAYKRETSLQLSPLY